MEQKRFRARIFAGALILGLVVLYSATRESTSKSTSDNHADTGAEELTEGESLAVTDSTEPLDVESYLQQVASRSPYDFGKNSPLCRTDRASVRAALISYDRTRLADVRLKAKYLHSYRGLTRGDLQALVTQNDANAMAVLGVMSAYTQLGADELDVVPLMLDELETRLTDYGLSGRAEGPGVDFHEAQTLLYQAALYGRVEALSHVGALLHYQKKSAVQLGWITQEDYDQLPHSRRMYLLPTMVYRNATYVVFPDSLPSGRESFEEALDGWQSQYGEHWETVVMPIVRQFSEDLADAGLQLPKAMPRVTEDHYLHVLASHCTGA